MGRSASPMKVAKLEIQTFSQPKRRSSDSLSEADARSRFADGVGSAIAGTLKWNTAVMDWLACGGNMIDSTDNLDVLLVLAADTKAALGIEATSLTSVDFDQAIQEFASKVRRKRITSHAGR